MRKPSLNTSTSNLCKENTQAIQQSVWSNTTISYNNTNYTTQYTIITRGFTHAHELSKWWTKSIWDYLPLFFVLHLNIFIKIHTNVQKFNTRRFEPSVRWEVWSSIHRDYLVTHTHTQDDYYNPPPTRSG